MVDVLPQIKNGVATHCCVDRRLSEWEPGRRDEPCKEGFRGNVSASVAGPELASKWADLDSRAVTPSLPSPRKPAGVGIRLALYCA